MRIEYKTLILRDFGSFNGEHELDLSGGGVVLIRGRNKRGPRLGSNGAGKSTLLNALFWCLYGKTTNGLGSTDIKPWKGGKKTRVTLVLEVDGTLCTVTRALNPNRLSVDHVDNITDVTQEDVDKLVGMSAEVARNTIFLGQGRPLFHDLTNKDKMSFLADVLGLDRWDRYSAKAREKANDLNDDLSDLDMKSATNKGHIRQLKEDVKHFKHEADLFEEDREKNITEVQERIDKLTKEIDDAEVAYGALIVQIDSLGLDLRLAEEDLPKLTRARSEALAEYRAAQHAQMTVTKEHEEAQGQLLALKKSRLCPTCGQEIKRESTYLKNMEKIKGRVDELTKQMNADAVEQAKKRLDKADEVESKHYALVRELRGKLEPLEREASLLKDSAQELKFRLKSDQQLLENLENDVNMHRDQYLKFKRDLARVKKEQEELLEQQAKLERRMERTKFWIKGFQDIRLHILEDMLGELELVTNAMMDSVGLVDWEVKYSIERETKAGTIQRGLTTFVSSPDNTKDVKWASWSGGEAQRLRLPGALALSQVLLSRAGVEPSIEILDEPSRGLSPEGVEDLCDFLSERARALKKTIFLVDHAAMDGALFDRVVTVTKTKEGSSIG